MRKKILAFVFAAALLMALAVPLFAGGGTALATGKPSGVPVGAPGTTAGLCTDALAVAAEHSGATLPAPACP